MENLMQDIENIISQQSNQINGKILGINYLEKLKYNLIDNLKISQFQTLEEIRDQEIEKLESLFLKFIEQQKGFLFN